MRKVTCAIWKQIIYAGRKMQRNLTTDTICQNLLLRSVTSELTLKKKKQWREEIQAGMQCKEAGKGWRVEGGEVWEDFKLTPFVDFPKHWVLCYSIFLIQ